MSEKGRLSEVRAQIAELDRAVARTLEERAALSKSIRSLAEAGGFVAEFDRDPLKFIEELPEGALSKDALRAIFGQVTAAGRSLERPIRVAYVGATGGFCHLMARLHFGTAANLVECVTVADALEEVKRQRSTLCVFPFESSVDGLILPAIFALAETDLVLVAERTLPAMLNLMSATGSAGPIEKIYGSSLSHAASERFRKREYPRAEVLDVRSPSEAAKAAKGDPTSAAVVPEATGREAGLEMVKEGVGDEADLRSRYGVVGARPASRTGNDTTSLLFSLDDAPGTLFQVLGHFAERGINLKKIQSRPVRGASWDYIFYVEVAGHNTDRAVVTALGAVKGSTKYLKLLGSFPNES
jgi:chorismate mutase/prephenate dehydratase